MRYPAGVCRVHLLSASIYRLVLSHHNGAKGSAKSQAQLSAGIIRGFVVREALSQEILYGSLKQAAGALRGSNNRRAAPVRQYGIISQDVQFRDSHREVRCSLEHCEIDVSWKSCELFPLLRPR